MVRRRNDAHDGYADLSETMNRLISLKTVRIVVQKKGSFVKNQLLFLQLEKLMKCSIDLFDNIGTNH